MKLQVGTAGDSPDRDSLSFLPEGEFQCWCEINWSGISNEWKLVFSCEPTGPSRGSSAVLRHWHIFTGADNKANSCCSSAAMIKNINLPVHIALKEISAVYLEREPSCALRIYGGKGGSIVIQLCPMPSEREHAVTWVDALFSAMKMQMLDPAEIVKLQSHYSVLMSKNNDHQRLQSEAKAPRPPSDRHHRLSYRQVYGRPSEDLSNGLNNQQLFFNPANSLRLKELESNNDIESNEKSQSTTTSTNNGTPQKCCVM